MLHSYWRNVFRPHLAQVGLFAMVSIVSTILEIASIGLVIPLVALVSYEGGAPHPSLSLIVNAISLFGIEPSQPTLLLAILLGAAALVGGRYCTALIIQLLAERVAQNTRRRFTVRLFESYLRARYEVLSVRSRGSMLEDVLSPPVGMSKAIKSVGLGLASLLQLIGIVAGMWWLSWGATLIASAFAVLVLISVRRVFEDRLRILGSMAHENKRRLSTLVVDALDGIRVVKVQRIVKTLANRFDSLMKELVAIKLRSAVLNNLPNGFIEVGGLLSLIIWVSLSVADMRFWMGLPALAAFVVALRRALSLVSNLNSVRMELAQNYRAVEVAEEILSNLPTEVERELEETHALDGRIESIVFDDVSFTYPNRHELKVIDRFSLIMRAGRVTALVGLTGAGKTTIVDLLVQLFLPTEGAIMVNGVKHTELSLREFRSRIGYISQDTFLFNATLKENIASLSDSVMDEAVVHAAQLAQIHEFIMSLPDKYETIVGDRGVQLSGGQRQRVAIARALVHRPEVLIFDEATSALDNLTEQAVQKAINDLRKNTIIIVIAHRLSTLKDADEIVLLEKGRIVERGTHAELLHRQASYWRLHSMEAEYMPTKIVEV